jgi:hydroxymethylpyrimidine pyrophosphatase-like HAD family hydrolase
MTSHPLRYQVLATDYDGTLSDDGSVSPAVLDGLLRFKASGRRLVLVTGRELDDLAAVFPRFDVFDRIVAENGGVLHRPADGDTLALGAPPHVAFVERLRKDGVSPLSIGRVIVSTRTPHDTLVARAIESLRLDLDITYNKGAVMVLPTGIDKASGLRHALDDLQASGAETVGIGDAENDEALLRVCSYCVAVANAVSTWRARAHAVTAAPAGNGVLEVIEALLAVDTTND